MPLWSRHEPDELRQEEDEARSERASALELSLQEWATPRRARLFTHSRRHNLDIASGIIVASALAGLGMVVVDRLFRPEWDIAWGDHWLGAPILAISAAVLIGLAWTLLVLSERAVASAFPDSARRRDAVRVVCHSAMAGMLCWGTAVWTFSGKAVSQTLLGRLGPPVFALGVVGAVAASSWLGIRAARQVARRRYRGALQLGGAYFALAAAAFWADMNLYVSLYERLHTLLEVAAFALLVAACQIWGFAAVRGFAWLRWPTRGTSVVLVTLAMLFVGYRPLRSYTDGLLTHAWVNQVYVGRTLKRAQLVELTLDGGQSLEMARVHGIAERFGLQRTRLDDVWLAAAPPPSAESLALRGGRKNIVFFYVDTLRYDVARDAQLMPHLARLASESLDFRSAYSTGSDTLRALPALTSGTHFTQNQLDTDLLALAQTADHESILIAPRSASEFLEKHRPSFAFEQRLLVDDYEAGKDVWGYGADRPSAEALVDRAIEVLDSKSSDEPFFMWMLHFDQHAWRELDEPYIQRKQKEFGIPTEGAIDVRYRVVARSIDEQLGRFLAALDGSGHRDDTVVVFVSDHGEGLGRDGFWVHSVFLWEELVHVPLLIRAPGVPARAIETAVSLVDLAPTLAPYFDLEPTAALYHGEDLMEFALGHTPNRRLPLVLRGANRDRLERIGLIDPATGRKLVLSLEAAIPELYSVPGDAQEAHNLARAEGARLKEMLGRLGRSPVYPRSIDDFDLLLDHGRLGLPGVEPPRTLAAARAAGEAAGGAELEAGLVAPPGAGAGLGPSVVDVAAALPGSELVVPGGSVETAAGAGPGGDALTVDALPIEARSLETLSVEPAL